MLGLAKNLRLHFIGIGGIGMSGIAEVLTDLGYHVSGSDLQASSVTEHLQEKGATIFFGHKAENVEDASLIVCSSAIDTKNPEIRRAQELNIPIIKRAEMLAELMRLKYGIAIAGSHGKTTTTSLVATIFKEAELDPTHIIGGIVHNLGGNAKKGDGQFLIAEADESDGSFLFLNPILSVVTNIDNDHLDHYGSEENIQAAFVEFVNKVPFYGRVVLNAQDANTQKVKHKIKRPMLWFGVAQKSDELLEWDYGASDLIEGPEGVQFDLYEKGEKVARLTLTIPGLHNVKNALAAVAISREVGIDYKVIESALKKFTGVGRRLEKLYKKDEFLVIDDYGHHPTEIAATLTTLRSVYPTHRLLVVFEPHRYTRTRQLWNEFKRSFSCVDEAYIAPIYAASEAPLEGITSERLVQEMKEDGMKSHYLPSLDQMKELVGTHQNSKTLIVTLGAGAISKKMRLIIKEL
jgi:UDP-N-acetylmuramate--alanine ligase